MFVTDCFWLQRDHRWVVGVIVLRGLMVDAVGFGELQNAGFVVSHVLLVGAIALGKLQNTAVSFWGSDGC